MSSRYVYMMINRKDNTAWYCFSSMLKAEKLKSEADTDNEYKIVRRKIF